MSFLLKAIRRVITAACGQQIYEGKFHNSQPYRENVGGKSQWDTVTKQTLKTNKNTSATHNFMSLHHVVKLLVNLLVFLFGIRREDVGRVGIGAVAASVLLLVQGLQVRQSSSFEVGKTAKNEQFDQQFFSKSLKSVKM